MKNLIYIFTILLFSCNSKQQHQDILKNVDEIKVQYLPAGTIFKSYKDSIAISIFKEIINGKKENMKKDKFIGQIQFNQKGGTVLTAALTQGGCQYIYNSDTFTTRLTYRVGQFLNGL